LRCGSRMIKQVTQQALIFWSAKCSKKHRSSVGTRMFKTMSHHTESILPDSMTHGLALEAGSPAHLNIQGSSSVSGQWGDYFEILGSMLCQDND
jgi:hypothetical protein